MFSLKSLRAQLLAGIAGGLLMLGGVGLFSMATLREVNNASASVRDHWLQSVRALGDLNNVSSDYRAAEASQLIALSAGMPGELEAERKELEHQVDAVMSDYESLEHQDFELLLYRRFKQQWRNYLSVADAVVRQAAGGHAIDAKRGFLDASRHSYDAASDTLGELTTRSVASAAQASDQAARAYVVAQRYMGAALATAFVGVALLMLYIHRSVAQPLSELAASMRALAEGRTDVPVVTGRRGDEIGEMAHAVAVFRNYVIELAQTQHGLRQQASHLEERLEQEQRLTAMQRNFVSMVSHEFRTPLTVVDGHAQRLIKHKNDIQPDVIEERAHRIRGAVLRLTQVMENLLTSSRLSEGQRTLHFHAERIATRELLRDACRLQREIAPNAHIFEKLEALPPYVIGDLHLLQQALGNLLSNALKYSPAGSEIRLRAWTELGTLCIAVSDQGIGIPADDLPRLFQCYQRAGNVGSIIGTGIGLYLVRMVAELHHGRVDVVSQEGIGSTFTLRLPLDTQEGTSAE